MINLIFLKTLINLGIKNINLVLIYKFAKYTRYYYFAMPVKRILPPHFFEVSESKLDNYSLWFKKSQENHIVFMNNLNKGFIYVFNNRKIAFKSTPKWFLDPYKNLNHAKDNQHWSLIKEEKVYDLKNIWELSRFNWCPKIAIAWRITRNKSFLDKLNKMVKDWCLKNPSNFGFNWICGQESSIRVINILLTWKIINEKISKKNSFNIENFLITHLERISKTILYAESQNNNHWISESCALFIGGNWLKKYSPEIKKGSFYADKGRKNLEKSVKKLIMKDGSFSQYSINYHRFLLDTLAQVELWREWLFAPIFSEKFYSNCKSATLWLTKFINTSTGYCPNIGGNDGGFCYQLHSLEYKNFKPSVQVSHIVFFKKYIFDDGPWDEPLFWLDINKNDYPKIELPNSTNEILKDGGYGIIRKDPEFLAVLRIPRYKFRPSQADPLHLDLSIDGINLLRDGGTYSYSKKSKFFNYFSGIKSHNSAQFDDKEPMKRISRFLWGNWLRAFNEEISKTKNNQNINLKAAYKFANGFHNREIKYNKIASTVIIEDYLSDFKNKVIIRWRLLPAKWDIDGNCVSCKNFELFFSANKTFKSIKIKKGHESTLYNQIKEVPVIEIELNESPCLLKTIIKKRIK